MKLTIFLLSAFACFATGLPTVPILAPDSISISSDSPGLGVVVRAIPGTTWEVWFNDNPYNDMAGHNGDFDFSDAVGHITFLEGFATLQYIASDSAAHNQLRLWGDWLDIGGSATYSLLTDGAPVTVEMLTNGIWTYSSGPASNNFDNTVHAWVLKETPAPPGNVPEPISAVLLGCGLIILASVRRLRRCYPGLEFYRKPARLPWRFRRNVLGSGL